MGVPASWVSCLSVIVPCICSYHVGVSDIALLSNACSDIELQSIACAAVTSQALASQREANAEAKVKLSSAEPLAILKSNSGWCDGKLLAMDRKTPDGLAQKLYQYMYTHLHAALQHTTPQRFACKQYLLQCAIKQSVVSTVPLHCEPDMYSSCCWRTSGVFAFIVCTSH